jgi:hypothetical protein
MDIDKHLRKLAKDNYYQTLYSNKELGMRLFKNKSDFTPLQISLVNYLGFYNNIFTDVISGDVDEIVTKDKIYEDAYSHYKRIKNKKKRTSKNNNTEFPSKKKRQTKYESVSNFKWIFKKSKREAK